MGRRRPGGVITLLAEPGRLVAGQVLALDPDEAHHLEVRRAQPGATLRLLDGAGGVATGRLAAGRPARVELDTVSFTPAPAPLTLGVGAGDKDRFGQLVEQATQLGATRIVPLVTERTSGVGPRLRPQQVDRLARRAREALKQCGATWAPAVGEPVPLDQFVSTLPGVGARWLADAGGSVPAGLEATAPLAVVVGPEGGLSAVEVRRLVDRGFQPVRLGSHLLRFETAAAAALTMAWLLRQRESHG